LGQEGDPCILKKKGLQYRSKERGLNIRNRRTGADRDPRNRQGYRKRE